MHFIQWKNIFREKSYKLIPGYSLSQAFYSDRTNLMVFFDYDTYCVNFFTLMMLECVPLFLEDSKMCIFTEICTLP